MISTAVAKNPWLYLLGDHKVHFQKTGNRFLLADFFFALAVKVIVEAFGRVACFITLAVVKGTPAAQVSAVCPRVYGQRAVSAIPVASKRVALLVTYAVIGLFMAVR